MEIHMLQRNWFFLPNCSSISQPPHRSLVIGKAFSGTQFNHISIRKCIDFHNQAPKLEIVSALAGESGVVEKELQFSPTFSDYFELLETYKTDRSQSSRVDSDDSLKKRGNDLRNKVIEKKYKKGRALAKNSRNVGDERSGVGRWGMVEQVLGKRISKRSHHQSTNKMDTEQSGINLKNWAYKPDEKPRHSGEKSRARNFSAIETRGSEVSSNTHIGLSKGSKHLRVNSGSSIKDLRRKRDGNSDFIRVHGRQLGGSTRREVSRQKNSEDKETYPYRNQTEKKIIKFGDVTGMTNRKITQSKSITRKSIQDDTDYDASIFKKYDANDTIFTAKIIKNYDASVTYQNASNNEKKSHKVDNSRNVEDIDFEDRTAFKNFEVFTDIRNRPRVLRMELEEKIQKLAKWLNASDVKMPQWQFSKIMHSAKIKFTDHSILRVVQILGDLGNWKRALQVVEWLELHHQYKSHKSRYIYTAVLDVLGKARRPNEALNIFYAMRQELSSYPDLAAYHCIAVTLGQAGLMKELFDIIDCMRESPKKMFKLGPLQKWDPRLEPDLVIYNSVLNACVQRKQWEGAFWVLQQLKQHGIKPTNTTYGLVMEVMLSCGKYNLVHEFFRKLQKKAVPSALNYKVLVNTLWREGKIDEAIEAVQDMERRGIVGSASLYYDLARCLCSSGRCQEALRQIDKICKVAKKPLVVTYTGLIQACLDAGSIENGAYIFNQMHKFCSPNTVTYNIMLKSYIKYEKLEEAKCLFQKILDSCDQIDNKVSQSQKVLPDKYTFNTMLEACASTGHWDDFRNFYQQMLHHGFHFDAKRHLRLVMDAVRAGKVEVLEITWEHLTTSFRTPPPPIIKERFCMKLEEDDRAAAISCISDNPAIEINAFSEKSWLNLFKNNAFRFNNESVIKLAHEVHNLRTQDCNLHPIYQNLLKACMEFVTCTDSSVNLTVDDQTSTCSSYISS